MTRKLYRFSILITTAVMLSSAGTLSADDELSISKPPLMFAWGLGYGISDQVDHQANATAYAFGSYGASFELFADGGAQFSDGKTIGLAGGGAGVGYGLAMARVGFTVPFDGGDVRPRFGISVLLPFFTLSKKKLSAKTMPKITPDMSAEEREEIELERQEMAESIKEGDDIQPVVSQGYGFIKAVHLAAEAESVFEESNERRFWFKLNFLF